MVISGRQDRKLVFQPKGMDQGLADQPYSHAFELQMCDCQRQEQHQE